MTLFAQVWAVDGETDVPAKISRLMLRSATRNGQGIVEIGDLRVEELDVPATAVVVRDGAFIARGAEELWQGSYWGYNIGDEQVSLTATSSAGPRSDLVYLRIEDPTAAGTAWGHNVAAGDPLAYLVVKEGVSSGTKTIPAGETGIPLALITRPASTGTVLQEHITDLRKMVDPRTLTDQLFLYGVWTNADTLGNVALPDYEQFPSGASWSIDAPEWAGQLVISYQMFGLQYRKTGAPGAGNSDDARGVTHANFGGSLTADIGYWVRSQVQDYTRTAVGGGGQLAVTQAMRGTTQTLTIEGAEQDSTYKGYLEADGGSALFLTYTFREVPRYDVADRSPS